MQQSCHCKLGRRNVNEVVEITNILVYFDGFVAFQYEHGASWNRMSSLCSKHYLSFVSGVFVHLFILGDS